MSNITETFTEHTFYTTDIKDGYQIFLCYRVTPKLVNFIEVESDTLHKDETDFKVKKYMIETDDQTYHTYNIQKRVKKTLELNGNGDGFYDKDTYYEEVLIRSSAFWNCKKVKLNARMYQPTLCYDFWRLLEDPHRLNVKFLKCYEEVYKIVNNTQKQKITFPK